MPARMLSEEWHLLAQGKCLLRSINFFRSILKIFSNFPNNDHNLICCSPLTLEEKIVTHSLEGGGVNRTSPSTFDTIHPIDLKFGTYNKIHLYFQLSETTWCLISFSGNNSQINDVTGGRHLGF